MTFVMMSLSPRLFTFFCHEFINEREQAETYKRQSETKKSTLTNDHMIIYNTKDMEYEPELELETTKLVAKESLEIEDVLVAPVGLITH